MSGRLEGRTAIVTGAAGGFGVVLVRALLAHRSNVMALDVNRGSRRMARRHMRPDDRHPGGGTLPR